MSDEVTDDYFEADAVSDGIAVRMSDNVAEVLTETMHLLLRLFEDGLVSGGGRFRRGRSAEVVLRDMFPDAYDDRAEARSSATRAHCGTPRRSGGSATASPRAPRTSSAWRRSTTGSSRSA